MTNQLVFSNSAVFELAGSDAKNFLNNQIVSQLTDSNETLYSVICNPKGRIIYSLFIFPSESSVKVVVDHEISDNFFHYVNLRKFRMNFTVNKINEKLCLIKDKDQKSTLHSLNITEYPDDNDQNFDAQPFWLMMFELELPWITSLTTELFIPQHLNLDQNNTIAFNKGCYPGQEIVARLHFIGKVKKRMQLIQLEQKYKGQAGENLFITELESEVQLCSPIITVENFWQVQAILPC